MGAGTNGANPMASISVLTELLGVGSCAPTLGITALVPAIRARGLLCFKAPDAVGQSGTSISCDLGNIEAFGYIESRNFPTSSLAVQIDFAISLAHAIFRIRRRSLVLSPTSGETYSYTATWGLQNAPMLFGPWRSQFIPHRQLQQAHERVPEFNARPATYPPRASMRHAA